MAKAKRKNPSKRLRFDVFKRDFFTCQYCGAQPPEAVLVCDHIDPVANGGLTTIDNLITACEPCNQGKSDKLLGDRAIRPDADILYLETQQEIAELKRYQKARKHRDEIVSEIAEDIQDRCLDASDECWVPSASVIVQMIEKFSPQIVDDAAIVVAQNVRDGRISDRDSNTIPYMWGVARKMAKNLDKGVLA